MSLDPMSHVKFKKRTCRPVDFRGQGPLSRPRHGVPGACSCFSQPGPSTAPCLMLAASAAVVSLKLIIAIGGQPKFNKNRITAGMRWFYKLIQLNFVNQVNQSYLSFPN